MRVKILISFTAFAAFVNPWAQGAPNPDASTQTRVSPIVFAERHILESKALGENRHVDVRLPASYRQSAPSRAYPVVFVLDSELLFETVAGIVGHLSSVGRMPEAIVVGIPNNTGDRLGLSPQFLDKDGNPRGSRSREDRYLRFFQDELLPFLDSKFRTAEFRILFGVSPTAAFTLHAFWRAPDLFQAHVAMVAGSIPGKVYPKDETLIDAIETSLSRNPDRKVWLYLSSAESNFQTSSEIATHFENLERRLRPYLSRGLSLKTEVVPGAAYATVLPALTSALNLIFPPEDWDPSYVSFLEGEKAALANLDAHFAGLSSRYGFAVVPLGDRFFNVNCLRGLGSRLRRQERTEEAIQVFRRWVELYPLAPRPYFHLAYALEANEQSQQALATGSKGLEIAREAAAPDLDKYESHFHRLEESILAQRDDAPR
ncbi:MAG: alpha/beta hydrolase-fold protein [Acidobacteriota bacterium]